MVVSTNIGPFSGVRIIRNIVYRGLFEGPLLDNTRTYCSLLVQLTSIGKRTYMHASNYLFVCLSVCLPFYVSISLSIDLPICIYVHACMYIYVYMYACLYAHPHDAGQLYSSNEGRVSMSPEVCPPVQDGSSKSWTPLLLKNPEVCHQ